MLPIHPRIVAVEPLTGMVLRLSFADGSQGTVDVARRLGTLSGVMVPLGDPAFFRQVTVDREAGTVVWPNGVDLDPDVLYEAAHCEPDRVTEAEATPPLP